MPRPSPTSLQVAVALKNVLRRLFEINAGAETTQDEINQLLVKEQRGETLLGKVGAKLAVTQAVAAWKKEGRPCPYCGTTCGDLWP